MEKEGGGGPLIESVSAGDRQRLHPLSLAEGGKKGKKCNTFSQGKSSATRHLQLTLDTIGRPRVPMQKPIIHDQYSNNRQWITFYQLQRCVRRDVN